MGKKKTNETDAKLRDLKSSLQTYARKEREEKKRREEKEREESKRRSERNENYNAWLNKLRPQAEKSARAIRDWMDTLLASDMWAEFAEEYKGVLGGIDISEEITYKGPSAYHEGFTEEGYQSLSLSFSADLYVHNHIKYGKSHELRNLDDMLEKVRFPVLIHVAETIRDGSIWTIIKTIIKKELRMRRR